MEATLSTLQSRVSHVHPNEGRDGRIHDTSYTVISMEVLEMRRVLNNGDVKPTIASVALAKEVRRGNPNVSSTVGNHINALAGIKFGRFLNRGHQNSNKET